MKKFLAQFLICVAMLSTTIALAQQQDANAALQKADNQFFIENKGQWAAEVLFLTRIGGLDAWITQKGLLFEFYKIEEEKSTDKESREHLPNHSDKFRDEHKDYTRYGHRVWMKLLGQNENIITEGKEKQEGYYNYFIGNDPSKHASNVGLYKEAIVKNVYNGIDVRYYFDRGSLRYDYIVQPGADHSQIVFALEGNNEAYLNKQGKLVFTTRFGELQLAELKTYQEGDNKVIPSHFATNGAQWSIAVTDYDRTQTLIIDPLIYSTYIGGSNNDYGRSIAIDALGNAYITGETYSTNYDITAGAFQTTNGGGAYDVFVTELNPNGTALVYSTYIGGSSEDKGISIAIDVTGNAYITGYSHSTNYDITAGAFQTTNGGYADVFVTKLNPTGTALVYSTYIGGLFYDYGRSIAVDASGNAYITGQTNSNDYDITVGAFQTTNIGTSVFVTKLNSSGTALIYSTYIGGSNNDYGNSIAIDALGNAYITGYTNSSNYDITVGAFQTTIGGLDDVFVTKLNPSGTALVYSTYIGGSTYDSGRSIAIDTSGNAYITGYTNSTNYDITAGAFQTTYEGYYDVFVTKLNPSGTALIYSTYIGGGNWDYGRSIAIDTSGNAYITGETYSTDYDITAGAYQTTNGGNYDVFATKLNPSGTALVYSTYIGGSSDDYGVSIAIDASGNPNITGYTTSPDYDITAGAFQTTYEGSTDVFVTKFDLCTPTVSGTTTICAGQSTTLTAASGADTYNWSHGLGTGSIKIVTPTSTTTYTVTGTTDLCTGTVNVLVTVNPVYAFTVNHSICEGETYNWHGTDYTVANIYTANYTTINGCDSIFTLNLTVITIDTSLTVADPVITANATGATFQWLDCDNGFAIIPGETSQIFTAMVNGNYAVEVLQGTCSDTSACIQISTAGIGSMQTDEIAIYPNPVTNELILENKGNTEKMNFEILNSLGQVVFKGNLVEKTTVQTSNFAPGVYLIKVEMGKTFEFKKIIKE